MDKAKNSSPSPSNDIRGDHTISENSDTEVDLNKAIKGNHTISDNSDTNIDLNKATKDSDQRNYPIKVEVEESKEEMWYSQNSLSQHYFKSTYVLSRHFWREQKI